MKFIRKFQQNGILKTKGKLKIMRGNIVENNVMHSMTSRKNEFHAMIKNIIFH